GERQDRLRRDATDAAGRERAGEREEHDEADGAELQIDAEIGVLGRPADEVRVPVDEHAILGAESVSQRGSLVPEIDRAAPGLASPGEAEERAMRRRRLSGALEADVELERI